MKCHNIYDRTEGKILIPGCMGTAVYGIESCTCRGKNQKEKDSDRVKELEKEVARLNRVIKNLLKK